MKNNEKRSKVVPAIIYAVGSVALFAVACVAISNYLPYVSGTITKNAAKRSNSKVDEDDWGPVVERKKEH